MTEKAQQDPQAPWRRGWRWVQERAGYLVLDRSDGTQGSPVVLLRGRQLGAAADGVSTVYTTHI